MKEKLNLYRLLKDNDPDEIFYNPLLGNVTVNTSPNFELIYIHRDGFTVSLDSYGQDNDGNIALFPSIDQRDWMMWKKMRKTPLENEIDNIVKEYITEDNLTEKIVLDCIFFGLELSTRYSQEEIKNQIKKYRNE